MAIHTMCFNVKREGTRISVLVMAAVRHVLLHTEGLV